VAPRPAPDPVSAVATPSRPAPTPPGTAPVEPTLGFRLPDWLDPVSAQIALKTAVGVVIAQTVALWFDWSAIGAAFPVLMLQTAYFGRTFWRAILRMTGAVIGSILGLAVLHVLPQDRDLLVAAVACGYGLVVYLLQGSRYPYAWLFAGVSMVLIALTNADQPEAAFDGAVSWISGNIVGITIVLIMHGVVWPHTGEKHFQDGLRRVLQGSARLFALEVRSVRRGEAPPPEMGRIEDELIRAMPELRLALRIAGQEAGRLAALRPDYELLVQEVQALVTLSITLDETLKTCMAAPTVRAMLAQSQAFRDLLQTLQGQIESLGAERTGDDASQSDPDARMRAPVDDVVADLHAREHTALDKAVLAAALAKVLEMAERAATVRAAFGRLSAPERPEPAAARLRSEAPHVYLGLTSDRWRKSIVATVAVTIGSLLWILLNWPGASQMILYASLMPGISAFAPPFQSKGALRSLIFGPLAAAVLYFGIMPGLTDMWQLAPFLILTFFVFGYFANSPTPSTAVTGMRSGLWLLELINLDQGQVYSFASFSETLLGIIGGVLVGVAVISLLDAPISEQRFRHHVNGFFAICADLTREMAALAPDDPAARLRLRAGRMRLVEQLRISHTWWQQVDQERFAEDERHKAARLLAAMRSLAFRQDAMHQAYLDFRLASALPQLAEPGRKLRMLEERAYRVLEKAAAGCEPAAPVPAVAELIGPYQVWHDARRDARSHQDAHAKNLAREVLVALGLHQALAQAINTCHDRFNALDWRLWDEAHF
jgi:uncharacterized membrane protein YccC